MKKVLYTNNRLKSELEVKANNALSFIEQYEELYWKHCNESANTFEIIEKLYEPKQEEGIYLSIKFNDEVEALVKQFPSLDSKKALKLIGDDKTLFASEMVNLADSIKETLKTCPYSLEDFEMGGEFSAADKVAKKIQEACTTYCENDKQAKLTKVAESISKIVKDAIEEGVLSKYDYKTNTDNILNVNTGDINYHYIKRMK